MKESYWCIPGGLTDKEIECRGGNSGWDDLQHGIESFIMDSCYDGGQIITMVR